MDKPIDRTALPKHWISSIFAMALIVALLEMPLQQVRTIAQNSDRSAAPGGKGKLAVPVEAPLTPQVGTDLGSESEPNGTSATANALAGTEGKIMGDVQPTGDIDFYSFTANAGDRIYAATMTSWSSSSSFDSFIDLIGPDGTTVLETDNDDGSFANSSSSIAGFTVTSSGTHYFRVGHNLALAQLRPYFLYFAIRSGPVAPEIEPNDIVANPVAASGVMSGVINPLGDVDLYSLTLAAGETVFLSLDADPERDGVFWNPRLGFRPFGSGSTLIVNDLNLGSVADPNSEAFFFTVKDAGTYSIRVDSLGTAGPTFTYTLNATVFPAPSSAGCTTYTSTDVPQTIPATAPPITVTSTLAVPAVANPIRKVNLFLDITHNHMDDLDVHLTSPADNDNGVFSDVGSGTAGIETGMNLWIDDSAAIPPSFNAMAPIRYQPEPAYRMDWFNGENPNGTWTLTVRDDRNGDGGTINGWALEICEQTPPAGTLVYSEDFEADDGGFLTSGTQDEWEWGTPAMPGSPSFVNCNSGVNCWKTDLVGTYNASSNQDLISPNLDLTAFTGTLTLSWAMRYQMDSANFDHARVIIRQIGNPANTRVLWDYTGPTMTDTVGGGITIGASAGWGAYNADISDFAGEHVEIVFHVDSNPAVQLGGLAIDDVQIRRLAPTAVNVDVGGRVLTSGGRGLSNARVTLTEQNGAVRTAITNGFGYYNFEDVMVGRSYVVATTRKGYSFNPIVFTPQDNIVDLDFIAEAKE